MLSQKLYDGRLLSRTERRAYQGPNWIWISALDSGVVRCEEWDSSVESRSIVLDQRRFLESGSSNN